MRSFFTILIFNCILLCANAFGFVENVTPPIVNRNVHVMRNINPSQCPRSWGGGAAPTEISDLSGRGSITGTGVGVQSCTGCAYDSKSGDCVCARCFNYSN